ncbi:MAG TPA: S41 family peptidase [Blastocatellia bacterium]|nr:S41 family peptidase [Blastocatellia bacterium]
MCKRLMCKRLVMAALFALIMALFLGGAWAQAQLQPAEGALRQQTFDIVWRTVKEKHFDPTLGGVDWDKARETYAPRAAAVKSDRELYQLLQEMLGLLRQSHFNIIPPEAITPEDQTEPSSGGVGVDLRLIGGSAIITRVEPDSSASRGGLRPGFLIKQVGDKPVDEILAAFAKSAERAELKNIYMTRRVMAAINGDPGSAVKIVYLDDKNQRRETTLAREKLNGELSPKFGNFPPQYTEFETKRIARSSGASGYIGYIRFNIFTMPVIEKLKAAITGFKDADGMIFDLRGNPGGIGAIAMTIAGRICDKQGSLGTMKMRAGEVKFTVFPQENPYAGPVAVLIDGMSASTSEVFSSGIQEMGRAVIVGERSAGAALPSIIQKLPTGALFQFAIADFKTPEGVLIEGRGVIPDVEVKYDRASLLAGQDAQLEAAVEQIRKLREKASQKLRAVD